MENQYNIEKQGLKFYLAYPTIFENRYKVFEQGTMLKSGKKFIHISNCGDMAVFSHSDSEVTPFTEEQLRAYLEFVDDYA